MRGEVLRGAARGAPGRDSSGEAGRPPRRARSGRRRRRLPARRRARARLHRRLLSAARQRPGALRPDRGDERAQRRLRDGRHGLSLRSRSRPSRRSSRPRSWLPSFLAAADEQVRAAGAILAGGHTIRDTGAEVRPRGRRHGAPRRRLGRRGGARPGDVVSPHEASRHRGARSGGKGRPDRGGSLGMTTLNDRGSAGAAAVLGRTRSPTSPALVCSATRTRPPRRSGVADPARSAGACPALDGALEGGGATESAREAIQRNRDFAGPHVSQRRRAR